MESRKSDGYNKRHV
ncbi:hypothetical protein PFDG_03746 [Plasmodium falciparum Dd2]|uniref:Uncharacterized protein n=1 Tax=Plasmodium falciparum (isolate Dd2) TaxID=57267 RepID=A0A0L7M573_PLAF4|nr:hypothetical protein PFDG_03746 [Plasmodium falciparum Dd2]